MPPKPQYLDENGNPVGQPAKVYLDENGNPAGQQTEPPPAADQPEPEGFWHAFGASLGLIPESGEELRQEYKAHPLRKIGEDLLGAAVPGAKGMMQEGERVIHELGQAGTGLMDAPPGQFNWNKAGYHALQAIPLVGGALERGSEQLAPGQKLTKAAVGTALGTALQTAPMALGAVDTAFPERPALPRIGPTVAPGAPARPPLVKRLMGAGKINEPLPGTDVTPAARYTAMKEVGINPDAAQATGSPMLNQLKRVNRNSLFASSTYDKAEASNVNALEDYTQKTLDKMSALPPEEGGAAVQKELLSHHEALKDAAAKGFDELDEQLKGQPIMGGPGLRSTARKVFIENEPYYKLHPELEPKRAMAIVRDIAGVDQKGKLAGKPRDVTYGELHRLRSDLLDFNNNNPDLVKNQANGWIQRLAGAADEAITSPRGSLTPEQVKTFREANDAWKLMKDTYDNPQSPFYHAVRTAEPSKLLASGISRSPEMAGRLHEALGPRAIGPIQRGVAESRLGTTPSGQYNFRNFEGMLHKLPEAYREALYRPEQAGALQKIGTAGTMLNIEPNPSGTAKLGQKVGEAGEMFSALPQPHLWAPTAAYHGAQYGIARLMNSPRFVDWLMSPEGQAAAKGFKPASRLRYAGAAAVAPKPRQQDERAVWATP